MDFIERLLGFSPDAGNGSFELLVFALLTVAVFDDWLRATAAYAPTRR